MNETEIGQGIYLVDTPKRAKLYCCDACGKLIVDTKKIPCPRCGSKKITFIDWLRKDNKITFVVKGVGVP